MHAAMLKKLLDENFHHLICSSDHRSTSLSTGLAQLSSFEGEGVFVAHHEIVLTALGVQTNTPELNRRGVNRMRLNDSSAANLPESPSRLFAIPLAPSRSPFIAAHFHFSALALDFMEVQQQNELQQVGRCRFNYAPSITVDYIGTNNCLQLTSIQLLSPFPQQKRRIGIHRHRVLDLIFRRTFIRTLSISQLPRWWLRRRSTYTRQMSTRMPQ